jgi:hypothetical protein
VSQSDPLTERMKIPDHLNRPRRRPRASQSAATIVSPLPPSGDCSRSRGVHEELRDWSPLDSLQDGARYHASSCLRTLCIGMAMEARDSAPKQWREQEFCRVLVIFLKQPHYFGLNHMGRA